MNCAHTERLPFTEGYGNWLVPVGACVVEIMVTLDERSAPMQSLEVKINVCRLLDVLGLSTKSSLPSNLVEKLHHSDGCYCLLFILKQSYLLILSENR